ncbi:hypothetical protein [Roseateles sp.]|uniref:hypothetical protein n=1 Tax=Roseateles sp. TaxID=1971397 RepID=UPI0039E8ED11
MRLRVIRLAHDQVVDIALTTTPHHDHLLARTRVVWIEDLQQFSLLFAGTM